MIKHLLPLGNATFKSCRQLNISLEPIPMPLARPSPIVTHRLRYSDNYSRDDSDNGSRPIQTVPLLDPRRPLYQHDTLRDLVVADWLLESPSMPRSGTWPVLPLDREGRNAIATAAGTLLHNAQFSDPELIERVLRPDMCHSQNADSKVSMIRRQNKISRFKIYRNTRQNHIVKI